MPRLRPLIRRHPRRTTVLLLAAIALAAPASAIERGDPLPDLRIPSLDLGDEAAGLETIPVRSWVPDRPRIFIYVLADHHASDVELADLQAFVGTHGEKAPEVALVVPPRPELRSAEQLRAAFGERWSGRLFLDDGFALGRKLGLMTVPNLVLVDGEGVVRVLGARSLRHRMRTGQSVSAYLEEHLPSGTFPTTGKMERYHPLERIVGRPHPEAAAELLADGSTRSIRDFVGTKPVLVVFWSVRCPHCTEELPRYAALGERMKDRLELLTVTTAPTPIWESEIGTYLQKKSLELPVLVDRTDAIWDPFLVTSTPTVVLIGTDGVVADAHAGAVDDLNQWVAAALAKAR